MYYRHVTEQSAFILASVRSNRAVDLVVRSLLSGQIDVFVQHMTVKPMSRGVFICKFDAKSDYSWLNAFLFWDMIHREVLMIPRFALNKLPKYVMGVRHGNCNMHLLRLRCRWETEPEKFVNFFVKLATGVKIQ